MRKYYWYASTFFKKHGVILIASVVGAIVLFTLLLPFILKVLDFRKKTYIGIVGQYTLTTLPQNIQDEISSGLTQVQPNGSVIPYLAERWNTEDDGKTYRFLIKKNLFWQDGKPFVPSDVNYNFNNVQTITTANEVIFKIATPFSPFPTAVSQPLFRITDEPSFLFFKKKKIIGLGAYQVVDWTERGQYLSQLVLENNDQNTQQMYRFYLTEEEAIAGFKRGEVDVLPGLSSPGDLKDWPTVDVKPTLDTSTYLGVFFNTSISPFSSNEIRQALNYALPKPTDETRAVGPIDPQSWAFSDVGKSYDFDEGRAIERLLSVLPGEPIHFDLTTTPTFADEAEKMKEQWEAFGKKAAAACQQTATIKDKSQCQNATIQVNIRITNFPDTSDFQALLIGEQSPTDPDQYNLWHSKPETNFTHYKNVRIDSLLEKGRELEDQKKRFEVYQNFQQFFSDDAPVIFIRHLYKYDVARKGS